jgi:formylglycine-generating enzyme required for sulfatase activity
LLQQIKNTDQPIEQILKRVVTGVKTVSKGQQEPWMEGSIEGDFCFGQCGVTSGYVTSNQQPAIDSDKSNQKTFKDCEDCPEMVVVPSGSFLMGTKQDPFSQFGLQSDEQPQHTVSIRSFSLGKYEVTQEQWFSLMGNLPSYSKGRSLPVEQVSWEDTQEYLKRLSKKTGKNYRLPSEAEWEFAARAGSKTAFSFGEDKELLGQYAWWEGNSQKSIQPVGGKLPNNFGLHDMHGNVMEWTQDCWNQNYIAAPTDGSAWVDGECSRRVMRGGSWFHPPNHLRSAYRFGGAASLNSYGFRVATDN